MSCSCIELEQVINYGIENMKNNKAPQFLIDEFVSDMRSNDWVKCRSCPGWTVESADMISLSEGNY